MHDDSDDSGFWQDEPNHRFGRIQARLRTGAVPRIGPATLRQRHHGGHTEVDGGPQPDGAQQLPATEAVLPPSPLFDWALGDAAASLTARSEHPGAEFQASAPAAGAEPVPSARPRRRSWSARLRPPDNGRFDPLVTRLGAFALVAALGAPAVTSVAAEHPSVGRPVSAPAVATCTNPYVVAAGDYWIVLARRSGTTLKQLLAVNNAKATTVIHPGRAICLPVGAVMAPAATKPVKVAVPAKAAPATPAAVPTTTSPPTTTTAPLRTYSPAEVVQIIRDVWPDELEERAIAIATRESTLKPAARNSCCLGLFQIYFNVHQRWLAYLGVTRAEQLLDPKVNAIAALTLYNRAGGWGPWGG